MSRFSKFAGDCRLVREDTPIIHNITNYVAMNFSANALLAIGASPIMSSEPEEMEDISAISSALVVNIGCIEKAQAAAMEIAASIAFRTGKPWVLDPVGAGASRYRTEAALSLAKRFRPSVIRGNASEIIALSRALEDAAADGAKGSGSRGVDSSEESIAAVEYGKSLASALGTVVSISGAVDYVTDGTEVVSIANGTPMMHSVTATGCVASAVTAAFLAVDPDALSAASCAMAIMGTAGEEAARRSSEPGSFAVGFIDALASADPDASALKIRSCDAKAGAETGRGSLYRKELLREQLSLYLVTDRSLAGGKPVEEIVRAAVAGGVTMVQLREKDIPTRDFIDEAIALKAALSGTGVPLIINDRVDVALAADADGVHIGQSDMPYEAARSLMGPEKIIGLSVENMDQVLLANSLDVDYIGVSPVFATPTKTDTAAPFGLEGLAEAVRKSGHPAVAIGGMNAKTAADVIAAGADGIAVVSAIMASEDPRSSAAELAALARRSWSSAVWKKTARIYDAILAHPFLTEMAAGVLDAAKFDRYLAQDEVYIGNYGRSMFALSDIMENPEEKDMFVAFAREGIESEKLMHELLIGRFGIDTAVASSVVTSTYNIHTEAAVATGVKEIGLAAILPCAWVYNEVGKAVLETTRLEGNPYKEWMSEYGNEEFTRGVELLLSMADRWAAAAAPDVRARMTVAFLEAALMEYAFWDYGYCGDSKSYGYMQNLENWL